jgi:hypothetical protein
LNPIGSSAQRLSSFYTFGHGPIEARRFIELVRRLDSLRNFGAIEFLAVFTEIIRVSDTSQLTIHSGLAAVRASALS